MRLPITRPLVYLITFGEASDANFESARVKIVSIVKSAVESGISMIQLREKKLSGKYLFKLASELATITKGTETRLVINDRADIAKAAGADGVHLTAKSLPVEVVRRHFGEDFLIGASTHSSDEIRSATTNGADFVVFGPVFQTLNKGTPVGVEKLKDICSEFPPFPVIGLGGIDETNFTSVIETGAAGIAAIRALNNVDSMRRILVLSRLARDK